ncbi:MAG: VCBS repeat-containing protein [Candidatus Thermoplasmatota archaeon]|nr:VCBS repeat-containing protein [Candidatus Thermoplasmatota archaeon]MBU1941242.1 VCBS repeat-containing protein [Candidatus Thermoplasmatota archaeon]
MNNIRKHIHIFLLVFILITSATPLLSGSEALNHEGTPLEIANVTFIEKSTGLNIPAKEGGDTELELADINNDGHLDIISVGDHGSPYINSDQHGIMVWLGDGINSWSVHQVGNFGYGGIEAGDLNLDGFLDVVWGIHHDYSSTPGFGDTLIGAALGDGTGTNWIPWATGLGTTGEDWGMFETDLADFDCNGLLDIISQSFGCCNGYYQYENNGDGTWTHQWSLTGGNTYDNLETGDFNADGYPDFAGNKDGSTVFLGDGTFNFILTQTGLPTSSWQGLDVGDMNQDGCDDIVLGYSSSGVRCYTFDKQHTDWDLASNGLPTTGSYHPQFGDLNGDGFLDIVAYKAPTGYLYLGDGDGNWIADGTFSVPTNGGYSAFVVDGDFDHDGREDVVIQAEQGSWPSYQNYLRAFSPWQEPTTPSARIQQPTGGETLRSGSIRQIRWLSAIPSSQGDSSVKIQISLNGNSGPWDTIISDIPNNGCYQWLVDASGSTNCRVKVIITTTATSSSAISADDFTILGYTVNAHGPYYASAGEPIQFTGIAENGNPPYAYHWDFGDDNTSDEQNPTHSYNENENYTVVLSVTDGDAITIRDSTWALIFGNSPPSSPTIDGTTHGKPGKEYTYSFVSLDPDDDALYYSIDWGDGTVDEIGPAPSGIAASGIHSWAEKGTYQIKAKATDPYNAESDWTTLDISMPMKQGIYPNSILENIHNRFPNIFPILRYFLGL